MSKLIYRERSRCRRIVVELIDKGYFTLEQIAAGGVPGRHVSDGLRVQAKKMLDERAFERLQTPTTVFGRK